MKGEKNYYKILGVHEKASNHELRKAFCKLTKELHPDTTSINLEDAKIESLDQLDRTAFELETGMPLPQ